MTPCASTEPDWEEKENMTHKEIAEEIFSLLDCCCGCPISFNGQGGRGERGKEVQALAQYLERVSLELPAAQNI